MRVPHPIDLAQLALAPLALCLVAACGETGEADIQQEDAIEAPDRPAPVTTAPRTDEPVRTVRFEAMDDGHVTGLVRLYAADGPTGSADDADAGSDVGTDDADSAASAAGGFLLAVTLDGLEPGKHAWHIHDAPCGQSGGIAVAMTGVGDVPGIAAPMVVGAESGAIRAEATVRDLALTDLDEGDYSLRVHAADGSPGPVVACADLSGANNATM